MVRRGCAGQNVGAHQFERVKKVFSLCVLYATLAGLLTGGLLTIFRRPLLSIYITDSPEALAIGMKRVFFTAMPYFLFGLLDSAGGALRSSPRTKCWRYCKRGKKAGPFRFRIGSAF